MLTLINIVAMCGVAYWMFKRWARTDGWTYWLGLITKLIAGVAIALVYDFLYNIPGDTWAFFADALKLTKLVPHDTGEYFQFLLTSEGPATITSESRSAFFVKIISLIALLSRNYLLTSMWFSLFSFFCCYRLVMKLDFIFPHAKTVSRIALLFTPSFVFWTSGIIKESVAFPAIAILVSYFLSFMRNQRITWKDAVVILFFLYLLLSLKYYWAAVLIPSMISGLFVHRFIEYRFNNKAIILGSWILTFLLLCGMASFAHPNFYMDRFLSVIIENHDEYVSISKPDNIIKYYDLSPTWSSMFINSPLALWSGLFRPMIFEAKWLPGYVAALENLVLLALVLWKLRSIRMPAFENRTIVLTTVVYVGVLCIFLALSTPNLGTLSRYRIGFLPFFVLMILVDHPLFKPIDGKPSDHLRSQLPRSVGSRDI